MFYAHARLDCTLARSHLLLLLGKCFTPADQALNCKVWTTLAARTQRDDYASKTVTTKCTKVGVGRGSFCSRRIKPRPTNVSMARIFRLVFLLLALFSTLESAAGQVSYVTCETTVGDFTIEMHRDWAPLGFDRFMELVASEFFADQLLYRTLPGFLVQFGIYGMPAIRASA